MIRFERYCEPKSIDECIELLNKYGANAKMLAGGTDLVSKLKNRVFKIETVIGLQSIQEAKGIKKVEDGIQIGALTTLMKISKSDDVKEHWLALAEAAGHVSSMQIRNMATIGGNACNASPSADAVQGLIVSDALVNIAGESGIRTVPIIDFFIGVGKTVLKKGEFVISFTLPIAAKKTGSVYKKFAIRGDTDISIVGVGSRITLDESGKVSDARISLASVGPKPMRATQAEKLIIGKTLTEEIILEAAELAANSCNPITDQRATKEYRREMIKVWTKHALIEAQERAKMN